MCCSCISLLFCYLIGSFSSPTSHTTLSPQPPTVSSISSSLPLHHTSLSPSPISNSNNDQKLKAASAEVEKEKDNERVKEEAPGKDKIMEPWQELGAVRINPEETNPSKYLYNSNGKGECVYITIYVSN